MKPSELLRLRGWYQGGRGHSPRILGSVCIYESLMMGETTSGIDVRKKLKEHIGCSDLFTWNDTPGRTKEEVIAALEAIGE